MALQLGQPELSALVIALGGSQAALGGKAIYVGDSVTAAGSLDTGINGATQVVLSTGWPTYAEAFSGGRLWHGRNLAYASQNSSQQLATFTATAQGQGGSICFICIGINDIGAVAGGSAQAQADAFALWQSNIKAFVAACAILGLSPVLLTIPPNNTANRHAMINQWNAWLKRYAGSNRIPLIDVYAILADPTNGNYAAGVNSDATHPNELGYATVGQAVSTQLGSLLTSATLPIAVDNTDPANLLTDGLFLGAVTSGIAASWVAYGSLPAGATASVVSDANVPGGKMQQIAAVGTVANASIYQNIASSKFVAGVDRLSFSGTVTSDGGVKARIFIIFNGGAVANITPIEIARPVTRGHYYCEFIVPTGTTSLDHLIQAEVGTGTVAFSQATVYNYGAVA